MLLAPAISADLSKEQTPPAQNDSPQRLIEDGMKIILGTIRLMLQSLPQYKAPEVLDNGDIIIRRVQPHERLPSEENKTKKEI